MTPFGINHIVGKLSLAFCIFAATAVASPVYTYMSFVGPAGSGSISVRGNNNAGDVTGYYFTFTGGLAAHEYIRHADGTFTNFSVTTVGNSATAESINNDGAVAGFGSFPGVQNQEGYIRAADGSVTIIPQRTPGAPINPYALNDNGNTAGTYFVPFQGVTGYFTDGSGFHTLTIGGLPADAYGMNNGGQVVGVNGSSSFIYNADGTSTLFTGPAGESLEARSINNAGVAAGILYDAVNNAHGFIRYADGSIQQIDAPFGQTTKIYGINDLGQVSGEYFIDDGTTRGTFGFIGTPDSLDTPEPATLATIGGGLVGLGLCLRRRSTKA